MPRSTICGVNAKCRTDRELREWPLIRGGTERAGLLRRRFKQAPPCHRSQRVGTVHPGGASGRLEGVPGLVWMGAPSASGRGRMAKAAARAVSGWAWIERWWRIARGGIDIGVRRGTFNRLGGSRLGKALRCAPGVSSVAAAPPALSGGGRHESRRAARRRPYGPATGAGEQAGRRARESTGTARDRSRRATQDNKTSEVAASGNAAPRRAMGPRSAVPRAHPATADGYRSLRASTDARAKKGRLVHPRFC